MTVNEYAQLALNHLEDDEEGGPAKAVDPATWMTIFTTLLPILLEWLSGCMEARAAKKAAKNPTPLQMGVLRMKARREMGGRAFRHGGKQALAAIVATAASDDVKEKDLELLLAEAA